MEYNLSRFLEAQETSYSQALSEIKSGRKSSHWMWYIFPQCKGLGRSETSKLYGIKDLSEAKAYLDHPVLGKRLKEITSELLKLEENDAYSIFGRPDNFKLKSCMTLFNLADGTQNNIFEKVLDKFFDGERDRRTENLVGKDDRL